MDQGDFREGAKRIGRGRGERGKINEKLCPFMSTHDQQVACTPQCKIYRQSKRPGSDFACPFSELQAISWGLRNDN